jgi:hypothetical protein
MGNFRKPPAFDCKRKQIFRRKQIFSFFMISLELLQQNRDNTKSIPAKPLPQRHAQFWRVFLFTGV